MNLAHLLNNSDPTQPRGIRVPGAESGSGAGAGAESGSSSGSASNVDPTSAPPVSTGMATVTRLHIASDALTLERVTGHLQEITARNGDSSEAVDVVVAVPAISWASQAGPEISRLMTTTAEMSASIMQRRITNRRIRWWLCVDLQFASETISLRCASLGYRRFVKWNRSPAWSAPWY
jgi:hypothetical protein